MKPFLDKDFLLSTPTAQKLFHEYAENMPIIDYHCHINPQEIAEDKMFSNITEVWLGGVRCVPTVLMNTTLPEMLLPEKNSRNGQRPWKKPSETRCTTGATWSCAVSSVMKAC